VRALRLYPEDVSWHVDPQPFAAHWHAIGIAAYLSMLAIYAVAGIYVDGAGVDPRLYKVLVAVALLGLVVALIGRGRGWQEQRVLLVGWPMAALVATTLVGTVEPDATRNLPGTITVSFVYVGLTCPRWRSLAVVPFGVVAFIMGGVKVLPGALPTVAAAAIMWVVVAGVPAWLIAQLEKQSALLRKIAQTDALTQLLDRSTLGPQLSRHASASAVVLIDLDHFKRYNDCHGHEAGDQLLVAFADALR
jgi:hypothetical protein